MNCTRQNLRHVTQSARFIVPRKKNSSNNIHVVFTATRHVRSYSMSNKYCNIIQKINKQKLDQAAICMQFHTNTNISSKTNRHKRIQVALRQYDTKTALMLVNQEHLDTSNNSTIPIQQYDLLLYQLSQQLKYNKAPPSSPNYRKEFKVIINLLDEMIHFQRITIRSFNTVLVACSHAVDLPQALKVFEQIKSNGKILGPFAYANVMNCCAETIKKKPTWLGKHESIDDPLLIAEELWTELLQNNTITPTIEVINCLLKVYAFDNRKKSVRTRKALDVMSYAGICDLKPEASTISVLCTILLPQNSIKAAEILMEVEDIKDAQIWATVLDACRLQSQWKTVQKLLQHIKNHQIASSNTQLKAVIKSCLTRDSSRIDNKSTGKIYQVKKHKNQLREITANLQQNKQNAQNTLGNITLKHWKRLFLSSSIRDIDDLMSSLSDQSFTEAPQAYPPELWNLYLNAVVASGEIKRVLSVLNKLIANKLSSRESFEVALFACSQSQCLDETEEVWRLFLQESPDKLNISHFHSILNCCANVGNADKAISYYNQLIQSNLTPTITTINIVLKALANQNVVRQKHAAFAHSIDVLSFYQRALQQNKVQGDPRTYFTMFRVFLSDLQAYKFNGQDEIAKANESALERITKFVWFTCAETDVEHLDVGVFNAAMDFCNQNNDLNGTLELFQLMENRGFTPSDASNRFVFAACKKTNNVDVGLNFLRSRLTSLSNDMKTDISLDTWNGAMELCASPRHAAEAHALFESAKDWKDKLQPNSETYIQALRATASTGNIPDTWLLYRELHDQAKTDGLKSAPEVAILSVFRACVTARNYQELLNYWQHVIENDNWVSTSLGFELRLHTLNRVVYANATKEYSATEHYHPSDIEIMLHDCLDEMTNAGILWTKNIYTNVCGILWCLRKDRDIFELVDSLLQSKDGGFSLISVKTMILYLEACKRNNDLHRVLALLDILRKNYIKKSETNTKLDGSTLVPTNIILRLLDVIYDFGEWQKGLVFVRDLSNMVETPIDIRIINCALKQSNLQDQFQVTQQLFLTLKSKYTNMEFSPETYIHMVYALEQEEKWTEATNLYLEMEKKFGSDTIPRNLAQSIALGRYSIGRHNFE